MAENLILPISFSPSQFSSSTAPQFNNPNAFTSGNRFEINNTVQKFATVAVVGVNAKRIFDKVSGSVGQYTGRTDLQRKIDRTKKFAGSLSTTIVLALVRPEAAAIQIIGNGINAILDSVGNQIQLGIDRREAEYRRELRGNRINESRSRI